MFHLSDFSSVFHFIIAQGYYLMFVIMLIEGPVITAAGGFAARLGYFNVYTVFGLSILGNLIPDIVYYAIGYWGRSAVVDRFGRYFKLDKKRIEHLEYLMKNHAGKTLTAVKLLPFIAVPGLIVAGLTKMPLKKYTTLSFLIIFSTSLMFLLIGYYTGSAYDKISKSIEQVSYLALGALLIFLLTAYLWKKIGAKIAGKIEKV